MPSCSRSATAASNLRSEIVPACHRLRSTATVSTSTRSGAATWSAPRISPRARRPSAPSSPITFARTEASTTINAGRAPRADPRRPGRVRRRRHDAARSAPAPHRPLAARPSDEALRPGTAEATARAARPDVEAPHGHRQEDRGQAHSCLQNASTRRRRDRSGTLATRSRLSPRSDARCAGQALRPPRRTRRRHRPAPRAMRVRRTAAQRRAMQARRGGRRGESDVRGAVLSSQWRGGVALQHVIASTGLRSPQRAAPSLASTVPVA